jgi:hypothetical protein
MGLLSLSFHYNSKIRVKENHHTPEITAYCWGVTDWLVLPASPTPPVSEYGLTRISPQ